MSYDSASLSQLHDIVNSVTSSMPKDYNIHCLSTAMLATYYASALYPKDTQANGLGDAFRHAYWSAYMCFNDKCSDFNTNYEISKKITDKYEEVTKDSGLSLEMDKLNNEIARNLAKSLQAVAKQYTTDIYGNNEFRQSILKKRLIEEIEKGTFYHIINGRLDKTNVRNTSVSKVTGKVITDGGFIDLKGSSIQKISEVEGNCNLKEGFLFYCDRPEPVMLEDLADSGKWLNKADVKGVGQVYSWHKNETNNDIKSCLLIHNPNSFDVTIDVKRYGLTEITDGPDTKAWEEFLKGSNSTKIDVKANSFSNLFLRGIKKSKIFGSIAELEIVKKGTIEEATVTLYDLAYIKDEKSGNGSAYATSDARHLRGVGSTYGTVLSPSTIEIINTAKVLEIGCPRSSFYEKELIKVMDESTDTSSILLGCFGQQIDVSLIVKNSSGSTGNFKIFMGSKGGPSHPVFKLDDGSSHYRNWVSSDNVQRAADLIDIGTINNGESKMINFSFAVSGMGSAPFIIGVRKA